MERLAVVGVMKSGLGAIGKAHERLRNNAKKFSNLQPFIPSPEGRIK